MNTRSDLTANSLRHKLSEKEMTEDDLRDIISARDLSIKTLHAQLSERDNDINKQHALKLVRVKSHMDLRAKLQQSLDQNTALKMKYAESLTRRNGLEEDLIESKKSLNRLQTFINRKGLMATAIKDLPSEVLEMIANNLDLKDLAPCRLVSKSMSEAANNRFAKVFFSRRFHVASSYSVKALVDITAHPFFGKHVTAVIMDGVRMTKHRSRGGPTLWTDPYDEEEEMRDDSEEESASILDNAFVRSGQCQSLLQKVFENIKGYGNSVEVGVGDCKYNNGVRSFGRKALLNHKVLYTYFMAETLGLTLAAAEAAKCPIQKLRVDIQGEAGEDYRQKSVRLDMRDNLQEIGRASAQGTEDLIKDTQEQSIDLLKQKVLLVRFNHVEYAGVIKIIVPNIQTQGSEV